MLLHNPRRVIELKSIGDGSIALGADGQSLSVTPEQLGQLWDGHVLVVRPAP